MQADTLSDLSGSTETDMNTYKLSQSLSRMTLSDIETYMKEYPLLRETQDLGMSGSLHVYRVSLAKDAILALMSDFTTKATGKDMDAEMKKNLNTSLTETNLEGTISYDPNDTKRVLFDGVMSSGSGEPLAIKLDSSKDSISGSMGFSGSLMTFTKMKMADGYDISMKINQ